MPLLRILRTQGEVLVVICDAGLLGKEFKKGELRLKVDESFYCGEEVSVETCLQALREATIANLVGSIVEHAIKAGFVGAANVIRIQNVPHAQMVKM
jgi:hypothetical protein